MKKAAAMRPLIFLGFFQGRKAAPTERVNIFELWRDQRSLDPWREVANPPKIDRRETYVYLHRTD
ncbi:hypothetical protein [Rhizobium sp. 007]|uniref:hypothetical protein n=1 Tax=Rhizobium sp. 007 TaxID=2785056 RepID=UPI000B686F9F|nr:hypothetical protein [Rhizobium sp. 007]OWK24167.1 hypothetical protein AJ87_24665 [Rhizobium yanglingense]QPB21283.1 hypothetical protein ISN39_07495 [Rhizobium sp. 007]